MKKLRCGVAGLGRGRMFVDILEKIEHCQVVAVCDSSPKALQRYEQLARHTDYDTFLGEGLDVVAVITPGPLHAAQSVAALRAGAHVLCETPPVYSLDEAKAVIAAVRQTGRKYMLAEDYIWHGWAEALRAKAAAGAFGHIVYAEGDYSHDCRDIMLCTDEGFVPYARRAEFPQARKTWRATHLPPAIYCSHTLGPLLSVMNDRAVSVYGLSAGSRGAPEIGTIDAQACLLHTARGSVIRLTNGFSVAIPMSFYYSLLGTAGSARILWPGKISARWFSQATSPPMRDWAELFAGDQLPPRSDGRQPVAAMVEDFIRSIIEDRPEPLDVYRSLDIALPGLLAHESAQRGGVKLDVPDLRA